MKIPIIGGNAGDVQESGSDVHQHKQALKDLEAKLVVSFLGTTVADFFSSSNVQVCGGSLAAVSVCTRWMQVVAFIF